MKNKPDNDQEVDREIAANNPPQDTESPKIRYILIAPLGSLLLGILLLYFTDTPWQFAPDSTGKSLFYGAVLGILSYLIAVFVTRLPFAHSLRETCRQLLSVLGNVSVPQMILIALSAGLGEEFLFRGFLQEWLIGYYSVEAGIAIAAVCFGLLHFATVSYFALTTLLGAAMGIAYHLSGSLLLVITWHACYDVLAIWVLSRKPSLLGIENSSNI